MEMRRSKNAEYVAALVRENPGERRYGLMMIGRWGRGTYNAYWYRDCQMAIDRGLVHEDDDRRLWPPLPGRAGERQKREREERERRIDRECAESQRIMRETVELAEKLSAKAQRENGKQRTPYQWVELAKKLRAQHQDD